MFPPKTMRLFSLAFIRAMRSIVQVTGLENPSLGWKPISIHNRYLSHWSQEKFQNERKQLLRPWSPDRKIFLYFLKQISSSFPFFKSESPCFNSVSELPSFRSFQSWALNNWSTFSYVFTVQLNSFQRLSLVANNNSKFFCLIFTCFSSEKCDIFFWFNFGATDSFSLFVTKLLNNFLNCP